MGARSSNILKSCFCDRDAAASAIASRCVGERAFGFQLSLSLKDFIAFSVIFSKSDSEKKLGAGGLDGMFGLMSPSMRLRGLEISLLGRGVGLRSNSELSASVLSLGVTSES
jgi:hypothetical protein